MATCTFRVAGALPASSRGRAAGRLCVVATRNIGRTRIGCFSTGSSSALIQRLDSIEQRLQALELKPSTNVPNRPQSDRSNAAATNASTADPWRVWKERAGPVATASELTAIKELEKKIIWLSTYMIHNANNVRPSRDGLKVGGHQASSTSLATVMAALYFKALDTHDRVAVKPHASPIFHAIQYLLGNQTVEQMQKFRALGGVQSYPSVTKDNPNAQVDFSTGSVGLGAAVTTFSSLIQDFLVSKGLTPRLAEGKDRQARTVAIVGDAELDEGNVYECLMESWKHDVRNNWWIIDYNRQSLDRVTTDNAHRQVERMFRTNGWDVVTIKYGKRMLKTFREPGGNGLKRWINNCDNNLFSALCFSGGAGFRNHIMRDIGDSDPELSTLLRGKSDEELFDILTNLGGHCMETLLEAFQYAEATDKRTCFIAYTVKGYGLPMAGHRDNHGLFLTSEQVEKVRLEHGIAEGEEWAPFAGMSGDNIDAVSSLLQQAPFAKERERNLTATEAKIDVPQISWQPKPGSTLSTQVGFGHIMAELAKGDTLFCDRLLTTSPDVATSTNLTAFINRRGVFARTHSRDGFKQPGAMSMVKWDQKPTGQHVELGIAENNLFLMLAAAGMSRRLNGRTLFPVGTLYDPFIARGLDALNYAVYQDARFMLVATPSGISLSPEGGAHQSINPALIGLSQPGLVSWEPAYADELSLLMTWSFGYMQDPGQTGGSTYFRLSTKPIEQPCRTITPDIEHAMLRGGYWHGRQPTQSTKLVIAFCGVVAPEVLRAAEALQTKFSDESSVCVLQVTSPDLLHNEWHDAPLGKGGVVHPGPAHVTELLGNLPSNAAFVTVQDGHPAALAWLGSVYGHRVRSLGVNTFGQSGDAVDLYHEYQIDTAAIIEAAHSVLEA